MELLRRAPESCQHVTTAAAATRAAYRVFATVATPTGGDNSDRIAALRKAARSKIAETDAAARAKPVQYSTSVRGVRHVVAVGSGKGGVGKSTVAVNLALGLSALGLRCGLLDADIHGPSIPRLMNLQVQPFLPDTPRRPQLRRGSVVCCAGPSLQLLVSKPLTHATRPQGRPEVGPDHRLVPLENYGLQVMSIGFLLPAEDPDTPVVWRSMMVNKALQQLLHEVAWRDLDVLVVDLPPGGSFPWCQHSIHQCTRLF
jgi:ATP-binding protein involved in chromosome partitioning